MFNMSTENFEKDGNLFSIIDFVYIMNVIILKG